MWRNVSNLGASECDEMYPIYEVRQNVTKFIQFMKMRQNEMYPIYKVRQN